MTISVSNSVGTLNKIDQLIILTYNRISVKINNLLDIQLYATARCAPLTSFPYCYSCINVDFCIIEILLFLQISINRVPTHYLYPANEISKLVSQNKLFVKNSNYIMNKLFSFVSMYKLI